MLVSGMAPRSRDPGLFWATDPTRYWHPLTVTRSIDMCRLDFLPNFMALNNIYESDSHKVLCVGLSLSETDPLLVKP